MAQTYIIPISYVKEYSIIDDNVDEKVIKTSILDSMQQMLEPVLGSVLYDKLLSDIEHGTLTAPYQELIVRYVWPFMLHCVAYKVALNLIYRITNSSVVKDSNEVSTAISLKELTVMRQERESGIKYTQEKLILFLMNSTTTYPEYFNIKTDGIAASTVNMPKNFFVDEDSYVGIDINSLPLSLRPFKY